MWRQIRRETNKTLSSLEQKIYLFGDLWPWIVACIGGTKWQTNGQTEQTNTLFFEISFWKVTNKRRVELNLLAVGMKNYLKFWFGSFLNKTPMLTFLRDQYMVRFLFSFLGAVQLHDYAVRPFSKQREHCKKKKKNVWSGCCVWLHLILNWHPSFRFRKWLNLNLNLMKSIIIIIMIIIFMNFITEFFCAPHFSNPDSIHR